MYRFENDAERDSVRRTVVHCSARDASSADARRVWDDLAEGRSTVFDSFTADRAYLVVLRGGVHDPLPQRSRQALELVMTGCCPKEVAYQLNMGLSTVAGAMKHALDLLGIGCRPSKAPLALVALMHASRGHDTVPRFDYREATFMGMRCEIMSAPIPNLAHILSPAVEAVVRLHAEGRTHAQIARLRGTSTCTVANQLAVAFGRLGTSGRLGLLEYLISSSAQSYSYDKAG